MNFLIGKIDLMSLLLFFFGEKSLIANLNPDVVSFFLERCLAAT